MLLKQMQSGIGNFLGRKGFGISFGVFILTGNTEQCVTFRILVGYPEKSPALFTHNPDIRLHSQNVYPLYRSGGNSSGPPVFGNPTRGKIKTYRAFLPYDRFYKPTDAAVGLDIVKIVKSALYFLYGKWFINWRHRFMH